MLIDVAFDCSARLPWVRIGGPGLGNLLFPYARAICLRERYKGLLVSPTWPQLKIGPVVRRESDWRWYFNLFKSLDTDVGLTKFYALAPICERVNEDQIDCATERTIVQVSGMRGLFDGLGRYRVAIASDLIARTHKSNTRDVWRKGRRNSVVCVHVRLGDFAPPPKDGVVNKQTNSASPMSWYVEVIRRIQAMFPGLQYEVHSDGTDEELASLLEIENVYRPRAVRDAWHAISLMANSRFLVASGSTFSMWASFLGGLPAIYYPGQLKTPVLHNPEKEFERFAAAVSESDIVRLLS